MDKKAKKILFNTFWKSGGWIDAIDRKLDVADFNYMLFDLKRFQEEKKDEVTNDDIKIFRAILDTISTSSKDDYPSKLVDRLKDNLKSTKDERAMLIEIMAALGILSPKDMNRPIKGKNDWVFVEQWRGEDGYNETIVKKYFGTYLSQHE